MSDKTIRIKDMEGDAAELTDFFKNNGFNLNEYLNNKPTKKYVPLWILLLVTFLFLVISCVLFILTIPIALYQFLILIIILLTGSILVIFQHNYEKWVMTTIAGFTLLCVILISLKIYTPTEVMKKIEEQAVQKVTK